MIESISLFCSLPWLTVMMVMVTSDNVTRLRGSVTRTSSSSPHWARPGAVLAQSDQKSPFKFRLINIFWAEKNDSEIFLNINDYLQK